MAARTTEFISKMKFIESKLTTRSAETNYEKIVHCFIFAMCFVISLHGKPLGSKCRFTKLCIMVKWYGNGKIKPFHKNKSSFYWEFTFIGCVFIRNQKRNALFQFFTFVAICQFYGMRFYGALRCE